MGIYVCLPHQNAHESKPSLLSPAPVAWRRVAGCWRVESATHAFKLLHIQRDICDDIFSHPPDTFAFAGKVLQRSFSFQTPPPAFQFSVTSCSSVCLWVHKAFAPLFIYYYLYYICMRVCMCMQLAGGALSLVSHSLNRRCHRVYIPLINLFFHVIKRAYTYTLFEIIGGKFWQDRDRELEVLIYYFGGKNLQKSCLTTSLKTSKKLVFHKV